MAEGSSATAVKASPMPVAFAPWVITRKPEGEAGAAAKKAARARGREIRWNRNRRLVTVFTPPESGGSWVARAILASRVRKVKELQRPAAGGLRPPPSPRYNPENRAPRQRHSDERRTSDRLDSGGAGPSPSHPTARPAPAARR